MAPADIAAAVTGRLAARRPLRGGGGVAAADPSFHMAELARQACAGDGTISLERSVKLFDE
eukprot:464945-Pleurochrysis_carterae.AAC.1